MSEAANSEVPNGAQPQPIDVEVIDIKIQLPSCINKSTTSTISVPSTLNATLGELKQSLAIIHILRNFTSYDIFYHSTNLSKQFDDLFTLESIIEELNVSLDKATTADANRLLSLSLKEKSYTLSSVYEHLEKFRESIGLNFLDKNAFSLGTLSGASKFNSLGLKEVQQQVEEPKEKKETSEEKSEEKKDPAQPAPLSPEDKEVLASISSSLYSPTASLTEYASFKSAYSQLKIPVKSLSLSQWAPVPPSQRVKGDLLYLTIQTLENDTINITCHMSGFFVNKCSIATFNPSLKVNEVGKFHKNFNLFDLVSSLSPLFTKTIEENEQKLSVFSPNYPEAYLIPSNSFVAHPWCINPQELTTSVKPDISRSQLPLLYNGVDGSSNVRDWNEDIQSIKELSKESIDERILREQLLNKSSFEFTKIATETAMNIIRGDVPSINPQDEPERNVYLRNGIFYFMNVNDSGAFDHTGSNEAARYTSSKDLASIKMLNKFDVPGVCSLVTCIVDYMGKRIVCQAPVPGIFNSEQQEEAESEEAHENSGNKVSYGLSVDRTAIYEDKDFEKVLKPIAEALHIKPHEVGVSKDVVGNLVLSRDTKGIKGSDGRKYLMDLYRTTPVDIEFIEENWNENNETSYPHRETVLRHEAVEEWWKRKVSVLIKAEADRLEKDGDKTKEGEEKPQLVIPSDKIVFNPDSFAHGNTSVNVEDDNEVRELSKFIKEQLIPEFLNETASQIAPFDGSHLSKSLHDQGINLRYLGYVAEKALEKKNEEQKALENVVKSNKEEIERRKAEEKDGEEKKDEEMKEDNKDEKKDEETSNGKFELTLANLNTLYKISIQEMVARASKHLLRQLSSGLPVYLTSHFVSHFHNCLLGGTITSTPEVHIEPEMAGLFSDEDLAFSKLTSDQVVEMVTKEVFVRFRYTLPKNWQSELIRPAQLLREIAIKYGIQWKAQAYGFTKEEFEKSKIALSEVSSISSTTSSSKKNKNKKKSPGAQLVTKPRTNILVADDIVSFVPIVKDSTYKSTLLDEIYEAARVHIYKNETEVGLTLLNELISFSEQIYGRVHPETTKFYGSIAQIYFELNLKFEACNFARKTCILSERISGFDAFDSVLAYINSSFYEGVNNDPVSSFKLYSRVISDWNRVYGSNHPSSINTISNLAETLSTHQLFAESHALYQKVLDVSDELNGEMSQVSGMIRYRFARSIFTSGDIQGSLEQFKKANEIFNLSIGPDDVFSKETNELVSKFEDHLKYIAEQKKNVAQQQAQQQIAAQQALQQQVQAKAATGKKSGKKQQQAPVSDPAIASQSVDDILKFINGSNPSKKKTKKSKK